MQRAVIVRGRLSGRSRIDLDEPVDELTGEVEVVVRPVAPSHPQPEQDIFEFLGSLPPGRARKRTSTGRLPKSETPGAIGDRRVPRFVRHHLPHRRLPGRLRPGRRPYRGCGPRPGRHARPHGRAEGRSATTPPSNALSRPSVRTAVRLRAARTPTATSVPPHHAPNEPEPQAPNRRTATCGPRPPPPTTPLLLPTPHTAQEIGRAPFSDSRQLRHRHVPSRRSPDRPPAARDPSGYCSSRWRSRRASWPDSLPTGSSRKHARMVRRSR
jgi:hypothetical protein